MRIYEIDFLKLEKLNQIFLKEKIEEISQNFKLLFNPNPLQINDSMKNSTLQKELFEEEKIKKEIKNKKFNKRPNGIYLNGFKVEGNYIRGNRKEEKKINEISSSKKFLRIKNLQSNSTNSQISNNNNKTNDELNKNITNNNKNSEEEDESKKNPTEKEVNFSNKNFLFGEVYYFMNNITDKIFSGFWNGTNPFILFEKDNGKIEMLITRNKPQNLFNLIPNMETYEILHFQFEAKDGFYKDTFMNFNFTLKFPKNFHKNFQKENSLTKLKNTENSYQSIKIFQENISINYYVGQFFERINSTTCNESSINLEFIRDPIFHYDDFNDINPIEFSNMKGNIKDVSCNLDYDFSMKVEFEDDFGSRVWNYSLILTLISLFEIFYIYKLVNEINFNQQRGKSLSLISVTINLIWNAGICTTHFFLSITEENFSYEYGIPSMSYFILFSIFELRLLFLTWKSRNNDIFYNDLNLFKRKLFQFYTIFYILLFIFLISIRFIFSNFWLSVIYFSSTWIFQIIHNAFSGTKPPISFNFIICITIGKLFPALYFKACPYNIFEFSPRYLIMLMIVSIILFQVLIIELQKIIGPKFILPKFLKKLPYNYYLSQEKEEEIKNSPIQINENEEDSDLRINLESKESSFLLMMKIRIKARISNYLESLKYSHTRTNIMKTPCNHFFHNFCLEKWLEFKNECPYCRREIPPLE